jgi:Tol biopolymer transport system component
VVADDAVFTPDGREITFDGADGIYLCERNGSDVRKLVTLPGRSSHPAWSRDGQRLRFTLFDDVTGTSSIWEVAANGENLHPVLRTWPLAGHEQGGRWSPDGRYFFFESTQGGLPTVWAFRDSSNFWQINTPQPVQLTFGPNSYGLPVPDETGRSVYVWGGREYREIVRYDEAQQRFEARLPIVKPGWFAFSRDGSQIAYSRDGTLWLSGSDGSGPRPLASDFSSFGGVAWHPDGQRILFGAVRKGESTLRFLITPTDGSTPKEIELGQDANEPVWSADGNLIFYSKRFASGVTPTEVSGIYTRDLQSSQASKIPGSVNLIHPTPSPDGHFLAAITEVRSGELTRLEIFDFITQRWTEIARGALLSHASWTRDSKYLYYQDLLVPEEPVFRFDLKTRKSERVLDFSALLHAGIIRCGFTGLAPDGSILAVITRGDGDLYRIDLELP